MQYAENEDKYIGKVTRGIAVARAINSVRNKVGLGSWVTVVEYPENAFSDKRTVFGKVIFKNEHFFTIQTKHYREAFGFVDIMLGRIEIVKGGLI